MHGTNPWLTLTPLCSSLLHAGRCRARRGCSQLQLGPKARVGQAGQAVALPAAPIGAPKAMVQPRLPLCGHEEQVLVPLHTRMRSSMLAFMKACGHGRHSGDTDVLA